MAPSDGGSGNCFIFSKTLSSIQISASCGRGPAVVATAPLAFDLLEFLIRNRERVLSRDDLIGSIWNGRIVSESALSTCVNVPGQRSTIQERNSDSSVLFANLSGDPQQDYFADGMVEEIITALSRLRWLFVIARNSSFTYNGRAVM
jgi:Transcriptional regulatory protein, C terminal